MTRHRGRLRRATAVVALLLLVSVVRVGAGQDDPADVVRRARALSVDNDQVAAIPMFERALAMPLDADTAFQGHLGLGIALDEAGEYAEAREHLQQAIAIAPDGALETALRALAVSYAFDGRPDGAAVYYQKLRDHQLANGNPFGAAETANALARVYLESGRLEASEHWYRRSYEHVLALPDLRPEQRELAKIRWLIAEIRLAARGGRIDEGRRDLAQLGAALDAMPDGAINADQQVFLPYAIGYLELAAGNADRALAALRPSSQRDPFVLMLMAQACELEQDDGRAREYYERILGIYAHDVGAAFARPLARRRLAEPAVD